MPRVAGSRRSAAQKAACRLSMAVINSRKQDKENLNPFNLDDRKTVSHNIYSTVNKLQTETHRSERFQKKLHNVSRKLGRSIVKNANLGDQLSQSESSLANTQRDLARALESEESLKRKQNATRMRLSRDAIKHKHMADEPRTHRMKIKGVISDNSREMIQELVGLGVSTKKVNEIIHTVADGIGLPVVDRIDSHSVSRITLEGGIAAEMQIDVQNEKINGVSPRLNTEEIRSAPGTVSEIKLRLDWHRKCDKQIPKVSHLKRKEDHIEALIAAVERYNAEHAIEDDGSDIDLVEEGAEDLEFGEEEDSDEDLY